MLRHNQPAVLFVDAAVVGAVNREVAHLLLSDALWGLRVAGVAVEVARGGGGGLVTTVTVGHHDVVKSYVGCLNL